MDRMSETGCNAHDVVCMMHLVVRWNLSNAISTLQISSKAEPLKVSSHAIFLISVVSACVVNQESEIVINWH